MSPAAAGRHYDEPSAQQRAEEVPVWDSLAAAIRLAAKKPALQYVAVLEIPAAIAPGTMNGMKSEMSTGFEIWDNKTHNALQFDRLDETIVALRGLVRRAGDAAVDGLALDAVSADGTQRMTLAEDAELLDLIAVTAASTR